MAQKPTQFCTECGAPLAAGQRFCTNCGATMEANANDPTAAVSSTPQSVGENVAAPLATAGPTTPNTNPPVRQASTGSDPYLTRDQMDTPLPPPPPPVSGAYNPYTSGAPGGPQIYAQNASTPSAEYAPAPPLAPTPGTYNTVPPYARARKSHGCLIVSIILLLVLAAGVGGVFWLKTRLTNALNNQASTFTPGTSSTASGGSTSGSTPGTTVSGSQRLNLKFTYSSIDVTVVSTQLASSFADDHSSNGQAGVVRLNLHETNNSAGNPDYLESDALLLVLPDGSNVQLTNAQQPISPASGVSRDNWGDFAVNSQVRLDQLSLHVGTSSQNQMTVSLKSGADLSKYQDRSSSPNSQFQYAGLSWTLKTATLSYSFSDKQATTGNLYVVLTLSIVNNTSNDYYIFPSDYMRIQAAGNSAAPDGTPTLPSNIAASGTGGGTVGFLVPQSATSFTLVMLARSDMTPPATQVTQTFQIQ